jgi:hypothetical protein
MEAVEINALDGLKGAGEELGFLGLLRPRADPVLVVLGWYGFVVADAGSQCSPSGHHSRTSSSSTTPRQRQNHTSTRERVTKDLYTGTSP